MPVQGKAPLVKVSFKPCMWLKGHFFSFVAWNWELAESVRGAGVKSRSAPEIRKSVLNE